MRTRSFVVCLALVAVCLSASEAYATSQDVSGSISSSTSWSTDTVRVTGNVYVDDGVTLTIDAGTYVEVQGTHSVNVDGRILAQGTEPDSIVFTAASPAVGWYGIRYTGTSATNDSSIYEYCRFEYGKIDGGALFVQGFSKVRLSNCLFTRCSGASNGGAVHCDTASIVIRNCVFTNDTSSYGGGAIYCGPLSSPTIYGCTISGCGSQYGGAIYCRTGSVPEITRCTFSGNSAQYGGVIFCIDGADATMDSCTVSGSVAYRGGAVYCSSSDPTVTNCSFTGDSARQGGVVHCTSESAPFFAHCTMTEARAGYQGGAVCCEDTTAPVFDTCTFAHNYSHQDGGSVHSTNYSTPTFTGCSFTGDTAYTGGSIDCYYGSSPVLTNCTITNAYAVTGGGISCRRLASPTITGCTITGCKAEGDGGGIRCDSASPVLSATTIENCIADNNGGGFYAWHHGAPKLTDCTISGCAAFGTGGGLHARYSADIEITGSTIADNTAGGWGAGSWFGDSALPNLVNCVVSGNRVTGAGGGGGIHAQNCSTGTIMGCLIVRNSCSSNNAGGVGCDDSSALVLTNCTIASNSAGSDQGGGIQCYSKSSPSFINCIIRGNTSTAGASQIYLSDVNCTPSIVWSNLQGGSGAIGGVGAPSAYSENVDVDPQFVDSSGGKFGLSETSPCINAGNPDTTGLGLPATDVAGGTRISLDTVDMGADEYNAFEVSGNITSDTTWNADVVLVQGHTTVFNGATLTIPPGTRVEFQGHYKLTVVGRLLAEGTAEDSIVFTAANTSTGWRGIRFSSVPGTNDSSKITYCRLEYGKATGSQDADKAGGALYLYGSSKVLVSHCTLTNCTAATNGGAIYCDNSSSPLIEYCSLVDNTATEDGGGICLISYSSPRIINCLIKGNTSTGGTLPQGGGISATSYCSPVVIGCVIVNNAAVQGGGMYCNMYSSPSITNCTIANNAASGAGATGGGISCYNNSSPTITNTIFWGNTLSSNPSQVYLFNNSDPSFMYCDIEDGSGGFQGDMFSGTYGNCLTSYPSFTDTSAGDYTLPLSSPCVNTGSPDTTGLELPPDDMWEYVRIGGDTVDIGAAEYHNQVPTVVAPIADVSVTEDGPDTVHVDLNDVFDDAEQGSALTFVSESKSEPGVTASVNGDSALVLSFGHNWYGDALVVATAYDSEGASISDTFEVNVAGENDPPEVVAPISDVVVNEDASGGVLVDLDDVFHDPETYDFQTTYGISSGNPSLVSATLDGDNAVVLSYMADAHGATSVIVTGEDQLGAIEADTFTVTVNPVNDAPTINAVLSPSAILEDASLQTVPIAGIGDGDAAQTQTITVTATSSNTSVIPNPSVSYTSGNATGSLSYTPVGNASGTATIRVLVKDNGGTANGGVDSAAVTFVVNVTAVNDAPTLGAIADPAAIPEDAGQQVVPLSGIGDGDPDATQTLVVTATSSDVGLIPHPTVTYTSANATGSLSYTPVAGQYGSATVTVRVDDNGGVANWGVDSIESAFTVTVNSVNDTPTVANPIPDQTTGESQAYSYTFASNTFADADAGDVLTYTATLADDSPLPSWLSFAGATRTFSGSPGSGDVGGISVKVTATDAGSASVSDIFGLTVEAAVSVLSARAEDGDGQRGESGEPEFAFVPNPVNQMDAEVRFTYPTRDVVRARLLIYDAAANLVHSEELFEGGLGRSGLGSWDLTNDQRRKVSCGTYLAVLVATYPGGRAEVMRAMLGVRAR